MNLEEIFEKLMDESYNLKDFRIEFFKNRSEISVKCDEYELSVIKYISNLTYQINISYNNWVIDYYEIDVFSYDALILKFNKKTKELLENKTSDWLNEKKKLERKFKLNNLDNESNL